MTSSLDFDHQPAASGDPEFETSNPPRCQAASWQRAEVLDVIDEATDAVTLRLRLESSVSFLPGQYYNIRLSVPGRTGPIQRAYSIASSPVPDPSIIDIGVCEVPGGLVSPRLVRDLSPGERLEVRGPVGRFTWTAENGGPVLLVGAGSGVVPLMSIIRYGVAMNLDTPMRLVCSFTNFEHAFYYAELNDLADRHPWLEIVFSFTRDPTDSRVTHHRRIDAAMVAEALVRQHPQRVYICGPPAMVDDVREWLGELGIDHTRIRTEKYD
ncbi:MAG: FAD-binding oxidoreductase [Acidimicrobiales bacterium]